MKNKYTECNYKLCVEIQHFLTFFVWGFLFFNYRWAGDRKESFNTVRDLFPCHEIWPTPSHSMLRQVQAYYLIAK